MRQERRGVFETNSSSTHSICISKAPVEIPDGAVIHFSPGDYGWENSQETYTADYLYTAILESGHRDEFLEKLKNRLDELGVRYVFSGPEEDDWYGIDHGYNLFPFVQKILDDKDMLARYLFGESVIYTGNDNQDCRPNGCNIAQEMIWGEDDYGGYQKFPNPYHDSEHYDYFYKGN